MILRRWRFYHTVSHVKYLTSDILGTGLLYDHLISQLTSIETTYHSKLIAPLTPILVTMTESGVRLDPDFIQTESCCVNIAHGESL